MATGLQNAEAALPILERIIAAELAADEARQDIVRDELADVRDELSAKLCDLKAETTRGAALQVAVAMGFGELIRGCFQQEDRDFYHTRQEALLRSALGVIGGDLPDTVWTAFVGRRRPTLRAEVRS